MSKKTSRAPADSDSVPAHLHAIRDASALSGAVAGAAVGAIAGPVGAVAGSLIGTAIGAFAGQTMDDEDTGAIEHDQELDRRIGVSEGDIGAASPGSPPAARGTYSAASAGASTGGGSVPSAGPMQDLDPES